MPVQALQCKECDHLPARRPLRVRAASGRSRWPTTTRDRSRGGQAEDPGRAADDLAPPTSCPSPGSRRPAAGRADAAPARPAARRGPGRGGGVREERHRQPDDSFKDRVVAVAIAKARELGYEVVACASTGNLANAVARTPRRRPSLARSSSPPTSRSRRCSPCVYGTNLVAVRGNYDDVNRLCTELSGDREWAFVNVNLRPYYSQGSKTIAFEIVGSRASSCPDRWCRSPPARCSRKRARVPGVARHRPGGIAARLPRRAGGRVLARCPRVRRGARLLPAGQARHDRQVARHRKPRGRAVRARLGAAL